MSVSVEIKEDVLASSAIELVRMFTVLSNQYSGPKFYQHTKIVAELESNLTRYLDSIKPDQLTGATQTE